MSQHNRDKFSNNKQFSQGIAREDETCEDKMPIESEVSTEEPLSLDKLADVSGGINQELGYLNHQQITSPSFRREPNFLEPSPTFPVPPSSESSP
ncbi:hypothetical protein H6G89_21470 [Oscillatoria sp. FACHB-1407]|uniref:hypothetical protein n=1 Tax=Oscillatoria sp. FACHB-1407 TaxID=2692847 RepID=UPI001682EB6E|nr:hypothetical protein [Oscillatoria sp. FACHB-1407]MBD2463575.1 hypothetical protein [Oscillatoria sp. FACHB-1407]